MVPTIKPFCGTHYNPAKIDDMSSVICPPYDVIDRELLETLKRKSSYNFSHILLATGNNYRELGNKFRQWIDNKVLIDDKVESLYLYEQKFRCRDRQYRRFGFLSLLRMDKKGTVHPHEHTLSKPKEDREKIISEMKTNLSPIFVIIPKPVEIFRRTYKMYSGRKPLFEFKDTDGNDNFVWKIDNKNLINKICAAVDKYKLVIADGHHRFEVSYEYYLRNKDKFKDLNYVLAFVASAQPGLLILPTHRIVDIKESRDVSMIKLREYFSIRKVSQKQLEDKLKRRGIFSFGFYRGDEFYFMKLKNKKILDKVPGNPAYKKLDTYLLHHLVLPLFTIEGAIDYTHSIEEAKKIAGKGRCAFLVRPASLKDVFEIANKGYRLPQKSTYFYPKIVSGAVVRRFEE